MLLNFIAKLLMTPIAAQRKAFATKIINTLGGFEEIIATRQSRLVFSAVTNFDLLSVSLVQSRRGRAAVLLSPIEG